MKRLTTLLILFMAVLVLSACGGKDEKPEAAEPEEVEKQSEMTELAAVNYLSQVTYRLIEANREEEGSFEQKSSLQAAIGRSESMIEEIKENYEEDLPIALALIELAELNKGTAEKALEGYYERVESGVLAAEVKVGEFADEYLDGEVPLNLQHMNGF